MAMATLSADYSDYIVSLRDSMALMVRLEGRRYAFELNYVAAHLESMLARLERRLAQRPASSPESLYRSTRKRR